jgi:hypothetical protein
MNYGSYTVLRPVKKLNLNILNMEGNKINVRVNKVFTNEIMAIVLPFGFETQVISVLRDKRTLLCNEVVNQKTGEVIFPAAYGEKGDFIDFVFTGYNGEQYCDEWIYHNIGPTPMQDIFVKI